MESLSVKEAAKLLDCSEYTLRKLAREKRIPHFRVGRSIRFRKEKLSNWIIQQERKSYYGE